jgi:hypothetical protein
MGCANATRFHRKSGGAQPRDLQFNGPILEMFLPYPSLETPLSVLKPRLAEIQLALDSPQQLIVDLVFIAQHHRS